MKPELTPQGVQIQTYQEIFDEIAEQYRDIYGADINLDPNSPDGQRVGIEAKARLDLQSYGLLLYNQLDPDLALEENLNKILKITGVSRRPATRSQVDIEITTDRPLTLPDDYTIEDSLGQEWVTLSEKSLTTGLNTVTFFSKVFGAIEADTGTITEQKTIILGVTSVYNPAAATVGLEEETDEDVRIRRNKSLISSEITEKGMIYKALFELANITDVQVYQNSESDYDANLELDGHSIWCVVEGGAVADIVEAIAKNKSAGTGIKGDISGTYTETITRRTNFFIVHEMQFDRPVDLPIYVRLTATRTDSSVPVDIESIKNNIASRKFYINDNLQAGSLYKNAYQAGGDFIITDLEISKDGITWTDGLLESFYDEKISISTDNITVTEVV
ncbi:MAG TPA: baseplate J/gp47 family protein [Bacteroidales bacterium]|nr:baseplate J/gp47 family protein [Bacteroidales bacterium]